MAKVKGPSFRDRGPKVAGYAHTSTSEKSQKAQRVKRLTERKERRQQ